MKVYLAGPISGLDWQTATEWRTYMEKTLGAAGIEALSPLRYKNFLASEKSIGDNYPDNPLATTRAIYTRDRWDVTRADIVFVNFSGAEKISIGTVMEIAWADMLNKPIVYLTDTNNSHNHAMIMESVGFVVYDIEEAVGVIKALCNVR